MTRHGGDGKLVLVASLYVNPGCEEEFERYEAAAARIMRRHGGAVERRIAVSPDSDRNLPYEVHVVSFPNRESFDAYRADCELQGLAELHARAIRETVVWFGSDLPEFRV